MKGFFESNGVISIEAEHYMRNLAGNQATQGYSGMGRTLSAMHPTPVTALPQRPTRKSFARI